VSRDPGLFLARVLLGGIFTLTCILIVAIWRVHGKNGLIDPERYQLELAPLAACLAQLGTGPGRWVIDAG
jgi:hypothetical protein